MSNGTTRALIDDDYNTIKNLFEIGVSPDLRLATACEISKNRESVETLKRVVHDRFVVERAIQQYNLLDNKMAGESWFVFMNHGYLPSKSEKDSYPKLNGVYDLWENQAYLYLYLVKSLMHRFNQDLQGRDVLDIGSGRGGGIAFLSSHFRLGSATGLDINPNHIKFSNQIHQTTNAKFVCGSAMSIPFDDRSMDIITNVESCHTYPDVGKFIAESFRVLRPGGFLLLTDVRYIGAGSLLLDMDVALSDFDVMSKDDITQNVLEACRADQNKFSDIHFGSKMAFVPRTKAKLKSKEYALGYQSYLSFILRKPLR